jgi:hypothetical protein
MEQMHGEFGREVYAGFTALASDAGRIARFEPEAKVLASLNHPHIAAIYGVQESGIFALAPSAAAACQLINKDGCTRTGFGSSIFHPPT